MGENEEVNEEEAMKNLSDGADMPDGVTPADQISQDADPVEDQGADPAPDTQTSQEG